MIAALHRAVALAECDDLAHAVAEYLHLDVTRLLDVTLQEDAAAAEILLSETLDAIERSRKLGFVLDESHADAAAARGAFQHDRVADAMRLAARLLEIRKQAAPRQERSARASGDLSGDVFGAEVPNLRRRRADECDIRVLAGLSKARPFTQKAVAGVNGFGAAGVCGSNEFVLT